MVHERFDEAYVPDLIPDDDLEYFETGGHGNRIGWGDTPGVLVIDMTKTFTKERSGTADPAVAATNELLDTARSGNVPIVFTRPDRRLPDGYRGTTKPKAESSFEREVRNQIDERLNPRDDEYVLDKPRASAFFDTHLAAIYRAWGVDTILITGLTTSGCVRASVVDSHSNNFNTIIVQEGCADRSTVSHEVSLFDMDMKYADVTPLDTVQDKLAQMTASTGSGQ